MSSPDISFWLDMMPDTVTLNPFAARSVSGGSSYDMSEDATKEYPAHIQMRNHLIVDRQGREILAKGRIHLGTTDVPSVNDLLTLPVRYVPRTPPILDVVIESDETGVHHVVLEIG